MCWIGLWLLTYFFKLSAEGRQDARVRERLQRHRLLRGGGPK